MVNDINHQYNTDDKNVFLFFLNISDQDEIIDAQLLKMTKNSDHITFYFFDKNVFSGHYN